MIQSASTSSILQNRKFLTNFALQTHKTVTKGAMDMAGMVLPIISSAVRSPWFKATRDLTTAYGDHEGRLTPVTFEALHCR
jgi:hypothetical protein